MEEEGHALFDEKQIPWTIQIVQNVTVIDDSPWAIVIEERGGAL